MFRGLIRRSLLVAASIAYAQTPPQLPSFEVASIKPAAPMPEGRMLVGIQGGPDTPQPGQMTFTNISIADLMQNAYDVKSYQIQGPDWLSSTRFDISAKVPLGTTKAQSKLMMQSLLAERFKLVVRHSTKESSIYGLIVAKDGPKLKESVEDSNAASPPEQPGRGEIRQDGPPAVRPKLDKDGMPRLSPGNAKGRTMVMMVPGGRMRLIVNTANMVKFSDILANQLDRPVVDMTGLKGTYDITLDFAQDAALMRAKMAAMGAAPPPGLAPDAGESNGPTIFSALTEQLGLRLEARKGPVDLLIVESVQKMPTEN
jgi:uncharacterized protein (TIGR03435 family)